MWQDAGEVLLRTVGLGMEGKGGDSPCANSMAKSMCIGSHEGYKSAMEFRAFLQQRDVGTIFRGITFLLCVWSFGVGVCAHLIA